MSSSSQIVDQKQMKLHSKLLDNIMNIMENRRDISLFQDIEDIMAIRWDLYQPQVKRRENICMNLLHQDLFMLHLLIFIEVHTKEHWRNKVLQRLMKLTE